MTITDSVPATRPTRRIAGTIVLWSLVLPGAGWAVGRQFGAEVGPLVQLFAFTPYVAAWCVVPAVLTLALRRWAAGAVAVLTVLLMASLVLPRALADGDRGTSTGTALHVLTSNMLFGGADPATIVGLVREHDVAVLAVQEFTPEGAAALAAAGLDALLPYSQLNLGPDTSGSGLYSRYPITAGGVRHNGGGFTQAYGTIQPPGGPQVVMESVHPLAPYAVSALDDWRADLAAQPRATGDGPLRILLGDFNATLDHAALRDLIASGYRDAADVDGTGLVGTWGPYDGTPLPPVTIDHVLVDRRIGVRDVSVHDIPDSDHRAVYASLTLPTG